ncbi:MAG: hypothetical protein RIC37_04355 [Gammaproteobacteria bacterium]
MTVMKPAPGSLLLILLMGTFVPPGHAAESALEKAQERIAVLEQENQDLKTELQALEQDVTELQQALDNHEVDQLKAEMEPEPVEN